MALTEAEELELLELEAAQSQKPKESFLQRALGKVKEAAVNAAKGDGFEMAGATAGGMGGGALGAAAGGVGAIPGSVLGSGLGAAAGKNIDDIIMTYLADQDPKSLPDELKGVVTAFKNGALSEMTGQSFGAALAKVGKTFLDPAGKYLKDKVSKRIMTSAVKDADLADEMLKRNQWGTAESLKNKAGEQVSNLSGQIDDILSKSDAKIDPQKIVGELEQLRKEYARLPGREVEVASIQELQEQISKSLPEQKTARGFIDYTDLPLKSGNELKKEIYSENKKLYKGGNYDPASIRAQTDMKIARGLKESIEDVAPVVKDINSDLGHNIQLRDTMETILDKTGKSNIVQLRPLLAGLGAIPQGAVAAAAAPLGLNFMGTTLGQTGSAVAAKKLGEKMMERSGTPVTSFLTKLLMQRSLQD